MRQVSTACAPITLVHILHQLVADCRQYKKLSLRHAPAGTIGFVDEDFEKGAEQFRFWRDLVSPVVLGTENIPHPSDLKGRSVLFVGNHTQFGLYDLPLLYIEMYYRGMPLTGLAHPWHWLTPAGSFFQRFGAVKATPLNAYRVLKSGKMVLLFPGGGREVVKRKGEKYKLLWKEEVDFVRLAAKCNALIIPFGAVGADDAFDLYMDTDEIMSNAVLGPLATQVLNRLDKDLQQNASELVFPITRIPGTNIPSPLPAPNLQRVYFKFGTPFDPRASLGTSPAKEDCEGMYQSVRESVENEIADLLRIRDTDPQSDPIPRLQNFIEQNNPFAI